ncbi:hypothetical protein M1D34_29445 (plasmid) [Ensifer sp. D2-11]
MDMLATQGPLAVRAPQDGD